jgi:hypothetical protein
VGRDHAALSTAIQAPPHNLPPRYNICPTDPVDVLTERDGDREFVRMRWGLVPSWWPQPLKELKAATFNARTVAENSINGCGAHREQLRLLAFAKLQSAVLLQCRQKAILQIDFGLKRGERTAIFRLNEGETAKHRVFAIPGIGRHHRPQATSATSLRRSAPAKLAMSSGFSTGSTKLPLPPMTSAV